MYHFVTGPLAWLSFGIFFIGLIVRIVLYIRGLDWKLDRVTYRRHVSFGVRGALRSIIFWLIPFGVQSWKVKPIFTMLFFSFHFCLLVTPIFLLAHNMLLQERFGFSLYTISETTADILTIMLLVIAVLLLIRRAALAEVRIITNANDILLLLITVAPFLTGFIASYTATNYQFWLILHILCGELMLIAIPFTKLSHMVLFFLTRAQLGMDFGIKRGGMKGKGLAW